MDPPTESRLTTEESLERAQEALDLAGRADGPAERELVVRIAEIWTTLAERALLRERGQTALRARRASDTGPQP
jgi:hypothetical protein